MAEIRGAPFISRCPSEVQERALRRGTTRLVTRVPIKNGTKFVVSGKTDVYEVNVGTTPSCSCPDGIRPCKHLCFIFLDVLYVPASSPIWWQTALLQSEVDKILGHTKSKRPSDSGLDASSSKKQRVDGSELPHEDSVGDGGGDEEEEEGDDDEAFEGPLTTEGIHLKTVRALLLRGADKHPSCIKYIEALRPTILDGLSETNLRVALLQIAREHADVAAEIHRSREVENSVILDFASDVARADWVIHSLDKLRESQKFERSSEISEQVDEIISRIVQKVNSFSNPKSQKNALRAVVLIGEAMFEADGEIHKALVGYGDGLSEVTNSLTKLAGVMSGATKAEVLKDVQGLAQKMEEYGHEGLSELVEEMETKGRGASAWGVGRAS